MVLGVLLFIFYYLLLRFINTVYNVRQYVCWLCLYPQDCILHWIYGIRI